MTIKAFISANRDELESAINRSLNHVPATASCYCSRSRTEHDHAPKRLSASDIAQWIANDEGLYSWARSEGVRV